MLLAVGAVLSFSLGLDNGLARTPPMGYIGNKECMNSNGRWSIDTAIVPVGSRSVASQPRFHRKHISTTLLTDGVAGTRIIGGSMKQFS